jgi:hypothetical protein
MNTLYCIIFYNKIDKYIHDRSKYISHSELNRPITSPSLHGITNHAYSDVTYSEFSSVELTSLPTRPRLSLHRSGKGDPTSSHATAGKVFLTFNSRETIIWG